MSETFGDAYRKLNEIKRQLTSKGFAKFKGKYKKIDSILED